MKKSYLLFPLSLLIITSQSYIFGGKIFFINDEVDNPYVVYGSFDFIEEATTQTSFEFSIEVVDNSTNDFYNSLEESPWLGVTFFANDYPSKIRSGGNFLWINNQEQPSDGVYYFESKREDFISPNRTYTVSSIDNADLAVGDSSNPIDDQITIADDLGVDDTITTLAGENPYIVNEGLSITKVTTNSVEFQLTVMNDAENSFVPENDLNVTLKDDTDVSHQTTASYVGTTEENKYKYKITELESGVSLAPGTHYKIYSLNNTGLATQENTASIDDQIEMNEIYSSSTSGFTTLSNNPYIQNGGFSITNVTTNSVEFQITVMNNAGNSFVPENDLDVTIKDSANVSHQTTASYVGAVDNTYTYEITELEPGVPLAENTTYQIYSLNNTGLTVENNLSVVDDEIIITDDLGVADNSFTTSNSNPYIEDGGFAITSTTIDSVEFQITVTNDTDSSFIPENDLDVTLKDSANVSHQTTANYVGVVGNTYTYKITELESGIPLVENTTYQIYSLNNTGLAIGGNLNAVDDEIIITDDLGVVDNSFTTSNSNPYIEDGGFAITSVTTDSVEFQITVTNDTDSSFIPENDLDVTIKDSANVSHQTTASYVGVVGNTYTYKITELESGIPLVENTTYQIYSLNNTGLAIGGNLNAVDDEIIITDDLGVVDNSFTTSNSNPYIEDGGFAITSTTIDSVEFQITVTNDTDSSFVPENDLDVTIKDSANVSHQTTANYVGVVGNTYTYKITELESGVPLAENTTYEIYSLNNTGLAIGGNLNVVDDEIIITDDLGVVDNSFTTSNSNPYIEDGGFAITSTTIDSVEFQITVTNDTDSSFVPENDLDVTIKDSANVSHQTTASYVGVVGNTYTYEINELEAGVPFKIDENYQIYSINNSNLAVGNDLGAIDDEILIEDELHADGNFLIDGNPYIEEGGFTITNVTANSVEFQITIMNDTDSSFVPENDLNVTLKDSLGYSHNTVAHYKEGQGNTYTYEINELEAGVPLSSNSTYEIYSLNNTGLAINDGSNDIDDEILIIDDLSVYDNTFETLPSEGITNESSLNSFAIILIFLIFILMAIAFYIKILFGKRKKH